MHTRIQNLSSLASAIRRRRDEVGLTQDRLAALAGLSRATVNEIETGLIVDLGFSKVVRMLALLDLTLSLNEPTLQRATRAATDVAMATRTASTSYRTALPPEEFVRALRTGDLPEPYRAHIATMLDEAPVPIIVRAVRGAFRRDVPKQTWRHVARWAKELKCTRSIWL